MGAGVRDDYLLANGVRLHYRDWGDRSAPPVVLLHGFTATPAPGILSRWP